jgi:WXG100 protein secretion system (Wss), protein YukD
MVADQRCRVTVIGTSARADVAIPALVPVGEYAYVLAESFQEPETGVLPAAWSLRVAGGAPIPPHASLESAGVTDGQLLYLCDLTDGEYDEPLVLEADECVASTIDRIGDRQWTPRLAVVITLVMSVLWLAGAVASWLIGRPADRAVDGLLALLVALALAVAAWLGQAERFGLTRLMRIVLAIGALPCLAVTGWFAGLDASAGHMPAGRSLVAATLGLAIGCVAGALAATAAIPGIETLALTALTVVVSAAICLLVLRGATEREVTAIAAVAGYGLITLSPGMAVRLAATWEQVSREEDTRHAVTWARGLTLAGTFVGSAVTALALVLMAGTGEVFDVALSGVLCCGLLLRAGTCRLLIEAVPIIATALLGLFWLAVEAPRYSGHSGMIPAIAESGLGVAMLSLGVIGTTIWSAEDPMGTVRRRPMGHLSAPASKPRIAVRVALTLCSIAALPLMLGTFGVYAHFASLGRHL